MGKYRSSRKNTSIVSVSLLIHLHLPCLDLLSFLLHLLLNEGSHLLRLHVRCKELDHLALGVNEKLSEVPRYDLSSLSDGIIE